MYGEMVANYGEKVLWDRPSVNLVTSKEPWILVAKLHRYWT